MRIHRWADRLCQYNYEPGKHNQAADFLSRSTPEIVDETNVEDNIHILTVPFDRIITQDELESEGDSVLQEVRNYVLDGWPYRIEGEDLRPFYNVHNELSVWSDVCLAQGERAVIPASLRMRVLSLAHKGHLGIVKTKQRCRESVWWPANR